MKNTVTHALLFVFFATVGTVASITTVPAAQINTAGSMHWFELESNGICQPSPVNRIARPQVCLGFEMTARLIAVQKAERHSALN